MFYKASFHDPRQELKNFVACLPLREKTEKLLYAGFVPSPVGFLMVIVDAKQLHMVEFCDLEKLEHKIKKLWQHLDANVSFVCNGIFKQVEAALDAYFVGENAQFSLPCAFHGSDFSCQVWQALQQIPVATTCSYAEQANSIGRAGAWRAVARANSRNQIAIIIPCHRVIGSDGKITGYASGVDRKRWLLDHEKKYWG